MAKKYDFSGYATKNNLLCTDGRTIRKDAFKHNDGQKVPLVWQHLHNDPTNILGHALLENREDGVYAYCTFNDTPAGINAKTLVKHGDITSLSIYANQLVEKQKIVHGGYIREVSLVLSGANPGAVIDNLSIQHADGTTDNAEDEAIIHTGLSFDLFEEVVEKQITHEEKDEMKMAGNEDRTVGDVLATFNEEQKTVLYALIAKAMEDDSVEQSDFDGGNFMKHNAFEGDNDSGEGQVLTHAQIKEIFDDAKKNGSLKESFLSHAVTYGIENIDYLFPDARNITNAPTFIKRDTEWVQGWMTGTKHTPFSRIKSMTADLTLEDARAKGYVKGTLKKEEFFTLAKRATTPTTIYKKQKLDRDDIIDITDLDVVAWLKAEMRMMLDEEIARAGLVGDGRSAASEDKISETNIRPVYSDADLYVHRALIASNADVETTIDEIIKARKFFKGTGQPVMYTTSAFLTDMLLLKDSLGRRIYKNVADLAAEFRVSSIVETPVLEGIDRDITDPAPATLDLLAILVNPADYTYGADKGGSVGMFDDFDIDYNQYKYLMETRCSGCLTLPKSAIVIEKTHAAG